MLPEPKLRPSLAATPALHERAMENLRFIRETMERSGSFTAVPGWGGAAMGATALGAAYLAAREPTTAGWLRVWAVEALVALALGAWGVRHKLRAARTPALSGPAQRFVSSFAPPMLAGALLTAALYQAGWTRVLPGLWLLIYGVAVITAGAFSVKIVPVMGGCFMALGAVALFSPAGWGNGFMASGFGGLQIIFGIIIARRYGG
ncbi:MAG TPA: hypothetical protein VGW33_12075 [Terriglobia bacterium]|nr:hypothetical protein [Terriglobia bacterium]